MKEVLTKSKTLLSAVSYLKVLLLIIFPMIRSILSRTGSTISLAKSSIVTHLIFFSKMSYLILQFRYKNVFFSYKNYVDFGDII